MCSVSERSTLGIVHYRRHVVNPSTHRVDRTSVLAEIRAVRRAELDARHPEPTQPRGWPICRHCLQSCTGSYGQRPHCVRCDTYHRLTLEVA